MTEKLNQGCVAHLYWPMYNLHQCIIQLVTPSYTNVKELH